MIWWRQREAAPPASSAGRSYTAPQSPLVTRIVAVLAVVVAGSAVYDIYRIGDSGAKATWTENFSSSSQQDPSRPAGN